VFKKHTTRQQLTDAAGWIKKYGIRLGSLNMLGGPGGTIEDEFDTVKLNIECKVDHPLVSLMQPYPQFDIADMTKEMGYAVSGYDDPVSSTARPRSSSTMPGREPAQALPLIVRFPSLMPAPRMIRWKRATKPYPISYMLWSEWMVAEQRRSPWPGPEGPALPPASTSCTG
jgi:hypothetical protein